VGGVEEQDHGQSEPGVVDDVLLVVQEGGAGDAEEYALEEDEEEEGSGKGIDHEVVQRAFGAGCHCLGDSREGRVHQVGEEQAAAQVSGGENGLPKDRAFSKFRNHKRPRQRGLFRDCTIRFNPGEDFWGIDSPILTTLTVVNREY
jgi:hypothetical protein